MFVSLTLIELVAVVMLEALVVMLVTFVAILVSLANIDAVANVIFSFTSVISASVANLSSSEELKASWAVILVSRFTISVATLALINVSAAVYSVVKAVAKELLNSAKATKGQY